MSPVSKSILAVLAIALVIGGTLALRDESSPAVAAQLTPSQRAEIAPPQKAEPPKLATKPVNDARDLPPPPDEDDPEDGNGS